jgi:hypothetical protein
MKNLIIYKLIYYFIYFIRKFTFESDSKYTIYCTLKLALGENFKIL